MVEVASHVNRLVILPEDDSAVLRVNGLRLSPLHLLLSLFLGRQRDVEQPVLTQCASQAKLLVSHVVYQVDSCKQVVTVDLGNTVSKNFEQNQKQKINEIFLALYSL
jgi:hypothetical protein